jgi:hypothetical protein
MATITRGDFVLMPRGRKPYRVSSIGEDGTLNLRRQGRQPAATRRSYRGFGSDGAERLWGVDPATVTKVEV